MHFECFVALRYLFTLRQQYFVSIISRFAILGVAIGVASLIVVIGVMNGFSKDLREKLLGSNAHILVRGALGFLPNDPDFLAKLTNRKDVVSASPFLYTEVIATGQGGAKGLMLRGVDSESVQNMGIFTKDLIQGDVKNLDIKHELPPIIIGERLAEMLGTFVGSKLNIISPTGKKTAAGFAPLVKSFRVVGIFRTGMLHYDTSLGYTSVAAAKELIGLKSDKVSGIELRVTDPYKAKEIALELEEFLKDDAVYIESWESMNAEIFKAMKLEKIAMSIILSMIILVGSFSIVTTLIMLVLQKKRDIAVLMVLGATSKVIRRVFLLQGVFIGFIGTSLGFVLGLGLSFILKKYQFIKLPAVYFVDYLPVRFEGLDLFLIGSISLLLCFLATIYPANRAASLQAADVLRYE